MIDLHTHSTFSDGQCTPTQLVEGAVSQGIHALAITDHDTVGGWQEFSSAAAQAGIEAIPAVELASDYGPGTLHILGYYIKPSNGFLRQHLDWLREGRVARNQEIFGRLNHIGLKLRWDEVREQAGSDSIGRLHIAMALVKRGYAESVKDAFSKYLGKSRPAYVTRRTLDTEGCIELIHQGGGVAVIAHPYTLGLNAGFMQELLTILAGLGMDGIEVYYPEHTDLQVRSYIRLANEFNLIMTGGSDFHGGVDERKRLGYGVSQQAIPASLLDSLKQRHAARSR